MAQQDIGSFTPQTSSDLNIGLRPAGIGQGTYYKGMMDEISLYDHALSGQEIESIFKAGSAGKCAVKNLTASVAPANEFSGKCIDVLSGDGISVQTAQGIKRIWLYGVDAPEKSQDYGDEARDFVTEKVLGKNVKVFIQSVDSVGNTLAWVFIGQQSLNNELLKAGYAWWDVKGAPKEAKLGTLEKEARSAKRGLWAGGDAKPIPPWTFVERNTLTGEQRDRLQKDFAQFPLWKPKSDAAGKPQFTPITLNVKPAIYDGVRYDGFRFRVERDADEAFVWAFVPPRSLGYWYIEAESGAVNGFDRFSRLYPEDYVGLDKLQPLASPRFYVQMLPGDRLRTGATYLIWFTFTHDEPGTISLMYTFAKLNNDATKGEMAAALGLKPRL